jgi:nucleotide-binding universal stress UspA family protein
MTNDPDIAVPDADTPAPGGGSGFRRILVPIRSASHAAETLAVAACVCSATNGLLHLIHVRIYDPPVRGAGRFYPQTRREAQAVLDEVLPIAWAYGFRATTAVVAAPRENVASAIAQQASAWRADMIVMTRRPGLALCRLVLGSVPDQVMRKAHCPVLAVRPSRKAARSAARSGHRPTLRSMGRSTPVGTAPPEGVSRPCLAHGSASDPAVQARDRGHPQSV